WKSVLRLAIYFAFCMLIQPVDKLTSLDFRPDFHRDVSRASIGMCPGLFACRNSRFVLVSKPLLSAIHFLILLLVSRRSCSAPRNLVLYTRTDENGKPSHGIESQKT